MGLPCFMIHYIRSVPKLMKLTASQILDHLNDVLTLILDKSLSCLLMKPDVLEAMMPSNHDHHDHDDNRRSELPRPDPASLLPVPVYFFAEAVKKQLPVVPYRSFPEKSSGIGRNNKVVKEKVDCACIVCLNRIELSHEVRVPFNCCHVFHRECLDAWVDQGQGTCPLCRSKLLPTQNHDHDH